MIEKGNILRFLKEFESDIQTIQYYPQLRTEQILLGRFFFFQISFK